MDGSGWVQAVQGCGVSNHAGSNCIRSLPHKSKSPPKHSKGQERRPFCIREERAHMTEVRAQNRNSVTCRYTSNRRTSAVWPNRVIAMYGHGC